jgi:anti-anti-sigma regulatory factor
MIRIEEKIANKDTIILWIEGRLDRESFPAFRQMCEKYFQVGKNVQLNLSGLIYIGQDGLEYFRDIRDRVHFLGLNAYLKMAIQDADTEDLAS